MFFKYWFSASVSGVQSNRSRILPRDSVLPFWFIFSIVFNSCSSLRTRVCRAVWSSVLPGSMGVGNQNVFFSCTDLFFLSNSFTSLFRSASPPGSCLGLPCLPVWWTWIALESARRSWQFVFSFCSCKLIRWCFYFLMSIVVAIEWDFS